MEEILGRAWTGLLGALAGPLKFRFVLQPLVATVLAVRAGVRDAREGRPPFLRALLTDRGHRGQHVSRGWQDVGKLFVVAVLVDLVYQAMVGHRLDLSQSLLVATILAFVPYVLLCGPINRIARRASVTQ